MSCINKVSIFYWIVGPSHSRWGRTRWSFGTGSSASPVSLCWSRFHPTACCWRRSWDRSRWCCRLCRLTRWPSWTHKNRSARFDRNPLIPPVPPQQSSRPFLSWRFARLRGFGERSQGPAQRWRSIAAEAASFWSDQPISFFVIINYFKSLASSEYCIQTPCLQLQGHFAVPPHPDPSNRWTSCPPPPRASSSGWKTSGRGSWSGLTTSFSCGLSFFASLYRRVWGLQYFQANGQKY